MPSKLLEKGRAGEALQRFEAALALRPNQPELLLARVSALALLGRTAEVADDFRRVIELDAENAAARTNLEQAQRTLGKQVP